jgi:hypothetical protein
MGEFSRRTGGWARMTGSVTEVSYQLQCCVKVAPGALMVSVLLDGNLLAILH